MLFVKQKMPEGKEKAALGHSSGADDIDRIDLDGPE